MAAFQQLPWLQFSPDNFLQAIIAGRKAGQEASDLAEKGREANMEASQAAAALGERGSERQSAEAQAAQEFAQKQFELNAYRDQRNQERRDALDSLDQNRRDDIGLKREAMSKPRFFQTGNGGIFKIGDSGDLEAVREPDAKNATRSGTISIPMEHDKEGKVTSRMSVPVDNPIVREWLGIKPTVTETAPSSEHWYGTTPATYETNKVSLPDFFTQRMNSATSGVAEPDVQPPNWGTPIKGAAFETNTPTPIGQALPLPKSKADLKKGESYQTSRGVAVWDGKQFIQHPE